jgi:hypothetical protein
LSKAPERAPERGADIAFIDEERQLHVLDRHGHQEAQTAGGDPSLMWGWWKAVGDGRPAYSWPTWSPDGAQIACFSVQEGGARQVVVMDVGSIHSTAVDDLGDRLPIYLFWSPSGKDLAILTQQTGDAADRLHLAVARKDSAEIATRVAEGSPLFFTWIDQRIATFVGDAHHGAARIAVIDVHGERPTRVLPGQPGNFCAPVWTGDRLMFVLQNGPVASVALSSVDGDEEPQLIEDLHGLVALVRSPDGRRVARAVAPGGDGTPYRDLAIIDGQTGSVTPVADHPCLAFMWTPDGSSLLCAQVDTDRNLVTWNRVDLNGQITHIIDMYPTRDYGFYLRFFEQYVQSHPLVDPSGRSLLMAGGLDGYGDPHRTSGLWEVPLDGGKANQIGEGLFGVYGPVRR